MHIIIIGNGISGITTARWLRKLSEHQITVISEEHDYFFSRTALMYIYMGHMRVEDTQPYEPFFWKKNRIDLKKIRVSTIDFQAKSMKTAAGETLHYDKLVLATGSSPNKFGWPGQNLDGVRGLYHMQDLEEMEKHSVGLQKAVIVGGGLIGIEMAEMFHSRHIPITFLVREPSFWNKVIPKEESEMVNRHIREHGIDLRLGEELDTIHDNGQGKVGAITTKNAGERIECGFVGLTAGVHPNVSFLKETGLEIEKGIIVNEHLQTNMDGVYAIGDCAQLRNPQEGRRSIEAVWYTGRMMGEVAAHNIVGKKVAYNPGIWFNSAKFLDIEYQVYGDIPAELPEHVETIYWEHTNGKMSIRINYDKQTGAVTGFNLMGVRYRHEVCEKWLSEKTDIETVLQNLGLANFDPEFFKEYESDVVALYNEQSGKNLALKQKRGLSAVLSFLGK